MHDELLAGLQKITRDCDLHAESKRALPRLSKHVRFGSIESSKSISRKRKHSKVRDLGEKVTETNKMAEPKEAADVARLFKKMLDGTPKPQMGRFLIYEEYGAMYAEMLEASVTVSRTLSDWDVFERGVEALVHHVLQPNLAARGHKKGLTLEDLLIKVRCSTTLPSSKLTQLAPRSLFKGSAGIHCYLQTFKVTVRQWTIQKPII